MKLHTLFLILLILPYIYTDSFPVSTCFQLQNLITGSTTISYYLTQNINCSTTNFTSIGNSSVPFNGELDGRGFIISNINIYSTNLNNIGMFGYAESARIGNLTLLDFTITAINSSAVGLLAGTFLNGVLSNISINTTSPSKSNRIISNAGIILRQYFGGLVGQLLTSTVQNIYVQNTFVNAFNNSFAGGVLGFASNSALINIYNFGFQTSHTFSIVNGSTEVGGLFGYVTCNFIYGCGISRGQISANSSAGAIAGVMIDQRLEYSYAKDLVIVLGKSQIGGIAGVIISNKLNYAFSFTNCYSRAFLSSFEKVGGIAGEMRFTGSNSTFNLREIYTSNGFSLATTNVGGSFGYVDGATNCTFTNTYYEDNSANNTLQPIGGSCRNPSIRYRCGPLYSAVSNTFSPIFWSGDNLKSEIPSIFGFCECPTNCPTTALFSLTPSTLRPSTITPPTRTPSTLTPSTTIPSSETPSTEIPSTETPSTVLSTTRMPITSIPSTRIPSTLIPSTSIPSSCFYRVPNCLNCPETSLYVDATVNVSCILTDNGFWVYSFRNRNSLTPNISTISDYTFNATGVHITGNFAQLLFSTFTIVPPTIRSAPTFNVTGCVAFNGAVDFILDKKPSQGDTTFVLAKYNCTSTVNSFRFNFLTSYKDSNCDDVQHTLQNSRNTLSVIVTADLGRYCKSSLTTGAIIAINVATGAFALIVITAFAVYLKNNKKEIFG